MRLTRFGKAVRKARVDTNDTLSSMSLVLGKSTSFLSAIEKGKTKIPLDIINDIVLFFGKKDFEFEDNLRVLANLDNGEVLLSGLSEEHKRIVATIANGKYTKNQLRIISDTLEEFKREY